MRNKIKTISPVHDLETKHIDTNISMFRTNNNIDNHINNHINNDYNYHSRRIPEDDISISSSSVQKIMIDEDIHFTTEEIRDRVLNEKNIPITEEFINSIFKRFNFDHTVKNLENFQTAMIHSSYLESTLTDPKTKKLVRDVTPIDHRYKKKCMKLRKKSYERLEFLGDSVFRHGAGKYLFLRYPDEDEGFLTMNRSKMENKLALSNLGRKLGLQNYAVIARHIEIANGRTSFITLTEDIFEAFIGALNLEIDENRSISFVWAIIEKEGDVPETIRTQNNYKDQLMQYFHKIDIVKHDLQYIDSELETEDGRRRFKTVVIDKNTQKRLGIGSGRSKKTSQQRAAKDALIKLGLIGNDKEEIEYFDSVNDAVNIDDIIKELEKVKSHVDSTGLNIDNDDDVSDYGEYDISLLIDQAQLIPSIPLTLTSNLNPIKKKTSTSKSTSSPKRKKQK